MMTYLEMVFVPVLLCMGLFAVFGLATIQGFRAMNEKVTGLDWRDFVGINIGIDSVIKDYQRLKQSGLNLLQSQTEKFRSCKTLL